MLLNILNFLSILSSIIALSLASISDLKRREVSDLIWIFYGLIGLTITIIKLSINVNVLWLSLSSIFLTVFISFILFEAGVFGGGDFKAMLCLALAVPLYPENLILKLGFLHPFLPLATLYNAFLFSCVYPIYILTRNLIFYFKVDKKMFNGFEYEPKWKKALALISGYKENFSKVEKTIHLYPIEEILWVNNKPLKKLKLFFNAEADRDKLIENLKESSKIPLKNIWVTPGLPMILFIALSFIINLLLGDFLTSLIKLVFAYFILIH